MAIGLRQGVVFAVGLLSGAVVAGWAVLHWHGASLPGKPLVALASKPVPATLPQTPAAGPELAPVPATGPGMVATAAPTEAPRTACPTQAIVGVGGGGDGHVRLQPRLEGKTSADVAALILAGKEAAAAGHPRDAEVDFLRACTAADRIARPDPMAAAEARYQLGRHYANAVLAGRATNGAVLLGRADLLYSDSLQAFRTKYGERHEKTRFAAAGLADVRQRLASSIVAQDAPSMASAPVAPPQRPPPVALAPAAVAQLPASPPLRKAPVAPRQVDAPPAEPPLRQATGTATAERAEVRPSFDCSKARSPSERTICADTELARMDRELGRLHARAKNSAPDAAAFRRQNDNEWRRRESTCRDDRECLLRWYAHRRDQLQQDVDESGQ